MRTSRPEHERWRPSIAPRLAPLPDDPEVIVVGAGAAGMAAAGALTARGVRVAVLEA
ncbi:FAD-dependent monooxygenase, partial [Methylobacterium goesingense]|uniref:FAD-dependent monooxygenase n=1 Tax=Methylobacterium goesingense TaxID=243690 RepID=UPI00363FF427